MKLNSLQDLYLEQLRDIYDAENQILKFLPQVAKACSNDELRSALEDHLDITKEQIERLDQIFESHGASAKGDKCRGMQGLIEEAKHFLDAEGEDDVIDAGLIAMTQRIEHYEIAAYGCCATYAKLLGNEDEADLLEQTLDEEKEADETLTDIAESTINVEAAEEGEGEEEEEERAPKRKSK